MAPDAGRYYVQAVNDKNGENKTSQPITLSVESESRRCTTIIKNDTLWLWSVVMVMAVVAGVCKVD